MNLLLKGLASKPYIPYNGNIVGIIKPFQLRKIFERGTTMKKLDKAGYICNIILSIVYISISFLSWLLFMASEATIGATNQVFIAMINLFCFITLTIPLLCILGIFLSVRLRKRGHSIWSFVVQFIPAVVFGINLLLLFILESLPATI